MIKRTLFSPLMKHLDHKEISLIIGPRQAGKTTLMKCLEQHVNENLCQSVFLNLDIEKDNVYFTSQEQLIRKIKLEIGEQGYVFIDEIQRKENAGLFLKGLYDLHLPYKLIVSGSGSIELKEKIHESLAGRKRIFRLNTLSWEEYVNYMTDYRYEDRLMDFFSLEVLQSKQLLNDYLQFGGYPRIILENQIAEKNSIMDELYQSYLYKDLVELLGIQKTEKFTNLVRIIASQMGKMVNIQELSNTLGLHKETINQYLWYMEKTYLIEKITPFFRNLRKEICKAPIYYYSDMGMRNFAMGLFGHPVPLMQDGFLFQCFVYHRLKELTQHTSIQIHYWRTTNKAEVDFVLDNTIDLIPIEVKFQTLTRANPGKSMLSFISTYHPKKAYVIHLGEEMHRMYEETEIIVLPYYKLLELLPKEVV
jgi:uncharacterized protein